MSRPSPEMRAVRDLLGSLELFGAAVAVDEQRAAWEAAAALVPVDDGVSVTAAEVGGVPGEWIEGPGADPGRVVLYLHGGGYVIGSPGTHREVVGRLAVAAGARFLLLDYRLAPEHPFPAALDDARAAVDALVAAGVAPGGLGIAGDSAGGGLAVATAMAQRDAGRPGPAALVCSSPWVDLALTGASIDGRAGEDPILSRGWLAAMAGRYLGDADPRDPAASPLYGDLRGLPPLLVLVGTAEVLHDDAVRLFERAAAADVETELEAYPGCIHLWMQLAPGAPEAQEAATRVGRFLRHRLTAGR